MKNTIIFASTLALFLGACNEPRATSPGASTATTASHPPTRARPSAAPAEPEVAPSPAGAPVNTLRSWTFDGDAANAVPAGFTFSRTGSGAMGRWVVRAEADAPSRPNVLAQLDDDDTDVRFPVAVANGVSLLNLRLSVRCKPISGRVDQACGLVFRYRDENNYYITRANPLENNVRLYTVKDGRRWQIASWSGTVTAGAWHQYAVEARGDHLQVFWDGTKVLDHHDATFTVPGGVGVWTKADSIVYFDDLRAESH
ncbi:MAG: hypothetical protein HY906_07150 [Deltaproteobacteria bacterium]|nr:hypothetical protein [Deltaproteobacteria bacterium]